MKRPLAVFFVLLVAACAPEPPRTATVKPGWQWTTDSVFRVTNAVRAGGSLQPQRWPNNARVAVLLSFDADNETVSLRFGEPTIGALSQGQYGGRGRGGWGGGERRLLQQAIDTLTRLTGERPVGYRAPSWNFSPNTLSIIRELGFLYESSMMDYDRPFGLM